MPRGIICLHGAGIAIRKAIPSLTAHCPGHVFYVTRVMNKVTGPLNVLDEMCLIFSLRKQTESLTRIMRKLVVVYVVERGL
jgi:hypothetical protein